MNRSTVRLRELYIRHQRGFLSYERLHIRELRLFVKQRGLPRTAITTAALRAQLEQADEDATFNRFSDLPPELRQQIFEHHFDSFDVSRNHLSTPGGQPPITLASRQTRLEALPLFYSRCRFNFRFTVTVAGHGLHPCVQKFVSKTTAHNFARIRFLRLSGFYGNHHVTRYTINILISLNEDQCFTKVSDVFPNGIIKHAMDVADRVNQSLMLEPHTFVRSIATRPGWQKLQKEDISEPHNKISSAILQALDQAV